nr:MAG TPA: hypothetical protein [Caudoviricetes sp.]
MENDELIEMNITDAIIERPLGFCIGKERFYLFPITLGKMLLISKLMKELDINDSNISVNPYLEALRLCDAKKEVVCRILSYHSFDNKADIFNNSKVEGRLHLFLDKLSQEEIATMLVLVLSSDSMKPFIDHLGIDEEIGLKKKLSELREDRHNLIFGGHSAYGLLIDSACQRYGWTMEYVVWGISYINLKMLMADKIESVPLTDEEMKQLHIFDNKNYINADDPKNRNLIREMIND